MKSRRILAVSSSDPLLQRTSALMRSVGYDVAEARSSKDAQTWRRLHRADLAIVDLDAEGEGAASLIREMREPGSGRCEVLVLVRSTTEARMRALFEDNALTNFLAVPPNENLDPTELTVTLEKILSKEIFGHERYLGPVQSSQTFRIISSRQKTEVVDAIDAFAIGVGCHRRVSEAFAVAADELITNAVYNAPKDKDGNLRFTHLARDITVDLDPGEEVMVQVAFDGRRLAIVAKDPFGSLAKQTVLGYLKKCFAKGDDQVDTKDGGAGLGLYYIFNTMHHFVINIAPGKSTEAVGLVEVTRSFKEHSLRAKSFNVFVQES